MTEEPRKRGRPARAGGAAPRRSIRATDAEWAAWQDAADAEGLDLADWIRAACDARAAGGR